MPMPTGVAKLNIFYSGSSGLVVDTDLCESGFNWILNDCNVNSEGSQGGNYVPPPQTIWYMMQINPSADQQTNGSSLRKRADTSFSTEDVIAVEDIPEVFSFSCYSGEISNYTDVLADVRDFCERYSGSRLTYGDSITQLTEFGSISVEYCNDTSCPEQWTVGGDCLVAYLCMLWWCGPGHGLTSSASAIEGCTTWSFTYTGNREETPLAKRQQQIGSGEAQCNNTGPSASYMDVLNSTEAFCSNSDFVSSFDFGSLGVVPSKTTTRYTFDWTTCMFGMLSVLWECGPAGDGLTWGGTHDNGTATWFIRIDKTAKGDDIVPDRTITARQSSGTAPFAPVFSVGGGTGTCASTGPPALWTDVMDDSIDYCAANDGQLLGQLGIRGNYAWGWFDFVYVGPIGAQVTQPFSRIACEFALQAILWECGTGDSSGTQTTVGGTYTYHPNEEVTWGIYVGRNNKRELQQTARQAIEGPSSPQLETAHLVTRGNSGYCNTNAAYVPWEPVAQAVENFCQSQNGQKLYIGGYNQEGPIEVLNTNGYTITLRVTYCPDAPKGIPTHMTIETSVCEGPYALSWPVWGCTSSDGYIYGGGYTDGCTIYSIDVEPPSNNEREALQSSHEGQTIGMRDIVVRQSNLTCDGGPLASSDELQSDARNFCRLQSGITLPPNQTQMSKYPLREGVEATFSTYSACSTM